MNLSKKKRLLFAVLSGILLAIAFPAVGLGPWGPISLIAWVPLLMIEEDIYRKKQRTWKVLLYAYLTFFLFNLITCWWVYFASPEGAVMAVFANAIVFLLPFWAFHITKKFLGPKEGYIGLLFYWLGMEYMHFHWELSWPWLHLGNDFAEFYPLVQWYEYSGVLGGSMWILMANIVFFMIFRNVFLRKESWNIQTPLFVLQGLLIFIPIIISSFMYFGHEDEGEEIDVLVIQPNIDPYEKFTNITPEEQIQTIIKLAESKVDKDVDLIIAPETALPFSIDENGIENNRFVLPLIKKLEEWGGPDLLIGSSTHKFFQKKNSYASRPVQGGYLEAYNSALLISLNKPIQIYHKSQLVLGVERLPFPALFEGMAIDLGGTSGTLGSEEKPFCLKTKGLNVTPCICYESAYGGYVAEFSRLESDFIAIITNDGWWKDTPGYKQHLSFASLRAIENRKYIARSANTGISALINSRGDILEKTGWWEENAIRGKIRVNREQTFYVRYGDIIGRVSAFTAILIFVYALFKWLRSFGNKTKEEIA